MSKKNQELAAAKAKKQKTILIVGGVLLLAVAAFQGPKLLKHGSTSDAAPAATSVATGTTATATLTSTGGAALIPVATAVPKGSASIAGVALPNATAVKVTTSQLASFTLFEAKDPFVQQEGGETGTAAQPQGEAPSSSSGEPGSSDSSGSAGTASTGGSSSSGSASTPAAPAPVSYATITFNGSAQQVQAKNKSPADTPLFVLRSLKQKTAKIGVA